MGSARGETVTADQSPLNLANFSRRVAGPAVTILACGLFVFLFHGLTRGIDYHAIIHAVRTTPRALIWLSILFTTLSYLALIARDDCALIYVGAKVAPGPLLLASCCASALGNAIGLGSLTGKSVRDRVYGAVGLPAEQIDRVMLFIDVGFGLGLVTFIAMSSMLAGPALAGLLALAIVSLHVLAAVLLLMTLGLIAMGVRHQRPLMVSRDFRSRCRAPASRWSS
jgi:phosphatidylglycerol lysyltransferase